MVLLVVPGVVRHNTRMEPVTTSRTKTLSDGQERLERETRPLKRVLRPSEAAIYLNLSASTLAKRRLHGVPPCCVSLGHRAVGYLIEDLDRWLEGGRREPTSKQATT